MKKFFAFCTVLLAGLLLFGCGKTQDTSILGAKNDTCEVSVSSDNFKKSTKIIVEDKNDHVEIHAEGYDDVRFDTPATISFKLDEKVTDEELEKWVGVYIYGAREYYIEPDYEKLSEGILEFDTYHFSWFSKKKLSDKELADKYAHQLATYDVMQEERIKEKLSSGNVLVETANAIYEELGITDDTLRGTLVRDFVGELSSTVNGLDTSLESDAFKKNAKMAGYGLSGLELLNAAQDGDVTGFSSIIAGVAINECCEHWNDIAKNYVPGAVGSIPEALYIAIAEGNIAEASEHVAKTIVSNVPVVKYTQMTAELVDYGVNMWTDSEVELAYEAYSGKSDAAGYKETPDWDTLMVEMRGAYTQLLINAKKQYCEVNNISMSELEEDKELCDKLARQTENSLKKQFETRKANDDKIREKEKEYQDIIKSFESEDVHLMTRGKNGFERGDDATFRLSRLMNIRKQVIDLLGGDDVEHLYTIFGTRNVEEQNKYIAQLVDTFMKQKNNHEGKKAVIEEVKYVFDKDVSASKTDKSDDRKNNEEKEYAWVLTDTLVWSPDAPSDDAVWPDYASASAETHDLTKKFVDRNGNKSTHATFTATCQAPPAIIYAGDIVSLNVSVKCTRVGDMNFSGDAYVRWDPSGLVEGGTYGGPKFESPEGYRNFQAVSEEGRTSEEATVSMTIPSGSEGSSYSIYFAALLSNTEWQYEWREVGN